MTDLLSATNAAAATGLTATAYRRLRISRPWLAAKHQPHDRADRLGCRLRRSQRVSEGVPNDRGPVRHQYRKRFSTTPRNKASAWVRFSS